MSFEILGQRKNFELWLCLNTEYRLRMILQWHFLVHDYAMGIFWIWNSWNFIERSKLLQRFDAADGGNKAVAKGRHCCLIQWHGGEELRAVTRRWWVEFSVKKRDEWRWWRTWWGKVHVERNGFSFSSWKPLFFASSCCLLFDMTLALYRSSN